MKRTLSPLACASIALAFGTAHATNTDPFDFDYEIVGGIGERPALIFNDGVKTYIQPRAGQVITADGGHDEGPYVVVEGTPESVSYKVAGRAATARWTRANRFIGGAGARATAHDDQPSGFDGFTNRLVLIGAHGALEPVRAMRATMPIGNMVKTLVPQGWTGAAQKDVDLTGASTFATSAGENWLQALDRLMTNVSLYADVDFGARHVRLRRDPPKSGALNYVSSETPAGDDTIAAVAAKAESPGSPEQSLLADHFGAQAIRDGDATHIQIRFGVKPVNGVTFRTPDGKKLSASWDEKTGVMTVDRAHRFIVADGSNAVEVTRMADTVYDFDPANLAKLQMVFDRDGSTYFKFAESAVQIQVTDVGQLGAGEQKGRFYHFQGVADEFRVTADGQSTTVKRRREVKFSEQPSSVATREAKS